MDWRLYKRDPIDNSPTAHGPYMNALSNDSLASLMLKHIFKFA